MKTDVINLKFFKSDISYSLLYQLCSHSLAHILHQRMQYRYIIRRVIRLPVVAAPVVTFSTGHSK